jgi:hypothetical protein
VIRAPNTFDSIHFNSFLLKTVEVVVVTTLFYASIKSLALSFSRQFPERRVHCSNLSVLLLPRFEAIDATRNVAVQTIYRPSILFTILDVDIEPANLVVVVATAIYGVAGTI